MPINIGRITINEDGTITGRIIDFVPVKHGRWSLSEDRYWKTCSECGAEVDVSMGLGIYIDDIEVNEMNYCPFCGAKMDEERIEDDYEEPEINPCRGCEDYDGKGGCLSCGGCGERREDGHTER